MKKIYLTKEEEYILDGSKGEIYSKLLKLLVKLGDSFNAEKLIEIKSAHTVLNFGLNFVNAAADILHQIAEAGLKVKVRTSADPIIDMDYKEELKVVYPMFTLHDQMMKDLEKLGIYEFTCTPYFTSNKPKFGEHCAWSESSAVIYINSVLGARSNREGGLEDLACAITGKTPYYGLHLTENRKGTILFKILFEDWDTFDLTSIGLKIGEISGNKIPVIEGLKKVSFDDLKNLGAASAASGAVALIHVIDVTPEAKSVEDAFQNDKPEEIIEIEKKDLKEIREKYSTEWKQQPKNISIGCPQLSQEEAFNVLKKLKGKKIQENINFWICTNNEVKNSIINSEFSEILKSSGAKITSLCPLLTPLPRPLMTNSAKTCFYSNASYRNLDGCIKIATEGKEND
ncbi:MAG: aconitase X [Promethearchaeota archaeon]